MVTHPMASAPDPDERDLQPDRAGGEKTTDLSTSEAWELLREAVVGRLAVVHDGAPDIFPVNHAVDHGSIVLRTAAGTKYAAARNQPVAFEVDGIDVETGHAWSVVARGRAVEVRAIDDTIAAMGLPLSPWVEGSKPHLLRILPDVVTGRRFRITPGTHTS